MWRKAFESNAIFLAEERTRKNEHGFSFLEAVEVHMTRISIFLQTKNAQTRTDSYCSKSNASKKWQFHFYKRKRYTTIFLIEFISEKWGVGPEGPRKRKALAPILCKNILLKETFVYRLRL